MKRSVKRSIFYKFCCLAEGLWIMMTDKKMILMTFATDNLYRETGTTSQNIYDSNHSQRPAYAHGISTYAEQSVT